MKPAHTLLGLLIDSVMGSFGVEHTDPLQGPKYIFYLLENNRIVLL